MTLDEAWNTLVYFIDAVLPPLPHTPKRKRPRKPPAQYRGEHYARRKAREIERHARESVEFMKRSAAAKKGWRTRRRNKRKRRKQK